MLENQRFLEVFRGYRNENLFDGFQLDFTSLIFFEKFLKNEAATGNYRKENYRKTKKAIGTLLKDNYRPVSIRQFYQKYSRKVCLSKCQVFLYSFKISVWLQKSI